MLCPLCKSRMGRGATFYASYPTWVKSKLTKTCESHQPMAAWRTPALSATLTRTAWPKTTRSKLSPGELFTEGPAAGPVPATRPGSFHCFLLPAPEQCYRTRGSYPAPVCAPTLHLWPAPSCKFLPSGNQTCVYTHTYIHTHVHGQQHGGRRCQQPAGGTPVYLRSQVPLPLQPLLAPGGSAPAGTGAHAALARPAMARETPAPARRTRGSGQRRRPGLLKRGGSRLPFRPPAAPHLRPRHSPPEPPPRR